MYNHESCNLLKIQRELRSQCRVVADSADYFAEFSEVFHHDEPLIHLVFAEQSELILVMSGRILNKEC